MRRRRVAVCTQGTEVIDISCHLLPGFDDGPGSMDEALALAAALVADGVTTVLATPHVVAHQHGQARTTIRSAHARLSDAIASAQLPLTVRSAGTVRLDAGVLDLLAADELPWLGGDAGPRTLLLELPESPSGDALPAEAEALIAALRSHRITPVLAHPERHPAVMAKPDVLAPLMAQGCMVQLTAGSLIGQLGPEVKDAAAALLARRWAHAIASNARDLDRRRPMMRAARQWLQQRWGEPEAERLTDSGPAALAGLLDGEPNGDESCATPTPCPPGSASIAARRLAGLNLRRDAGHADSARADAAEGRLAPLTRAPVDAPSSVLSTAHSDDPDAFAGRASDTDSDETVSDTPDDVLADDPAHLPPAPVLPQARVMTDALTALLRPAPEADD